MTKSFNGSLFKIAIGQDMSDDLMNQFQAEFGLNMSCAIDKFSDGQQSTSDIPEKTTQQSLSETLERTDKTDDAVEAPEKDAKPDLSVRKAFVERHRISQGQYVIKKPAKPRISSKDRKKPVILVRRDYDKEMTDFTTSLVISGVALRNALRHIFKGVAGFTLTESESTEITPRYIFWAFKELEMLLEHYETVQDTVSAFEIDAALKFVTTEFEELQSVLPSLLPHSITFEHLWVILPPDCLVVGHDSLNFPSIWTVRDHSIIKMEDGVFLVLNAEYLMWDGNKVGRVEQTLRIPTFAGVKEISDLPYIPLKYHARRDLMIQTVRERSRKALKFWTPDSKHLEHSGTGIAEVFDKVELYPFSGRVIVDPKMMQQMQPANKIMPRPRTIGSLRNLSRVCIADLTAEEEETDILATLLTEVGKPTEDGKERPSSSSVRRIWFTSNSTLDHRNAYHEFDGFGDQIRNPAQLKKDDPTPPKALELSPVQILLVSGLLHGYSLRESKWGAFAVDDVAPIRWNSTIFSSLVLEPSIKDTVYRVVTAHALNSSKFDDFVVGKGRGLVGLFFGPPGAGKTLTAEAIAETAKMPLYAVSSGALGHEAKQIHEHLSIILKLASHWKAVLLLDEADVFLAKRRVEDIQRNAIVSIFLRELEYYSGILLLTTNKVEVIDEAFQSRIHLSLKYPSLDPPARLKVWKNFVEAADSSYGINMNIDEQGLEALAEVPLNGRQIKNIFSIAVKVGTTTESRTITVNSLISTMRLLQYSVLSDVSGGS